MTSRKLKLHLFFRVDGPRGKVPAKQEMPWELTLGSSCSRWKLNLGAVWKTKCASGFHPSWLGCYSPKDEEVPAWWAVWGWLQLGRTCSSFGVLNKGCWCWWAVFICCRAGEGDHAVPGAAQRPPDLHVPEGSQAPDALTGAALRVGNALPWNRAWLQAQPLLLMNVYWLIWALWYAIKNKILLY